jgi:hypothetical protein
MRFYLQTRVHRRVYAKLPYYGCVLSCRRVLLRRVCSILYWRRHVLHYTCLCYLVDACCGDTFVVFVIGADAYCEGISVELQYSTCGLSRWHMLIGRLDLTAIRVWLRRAVARAPASLRRPWAWAAQAGDSRGSVWRSQAGGSGSDTGSWGSKGPDVARRVRALVLTMGACSWPRQ